MLYSSSDCSSSNYVGFFNMYMSTGFIFLLKLLIVSSVILVGEVKKFEKGLFLLDNVSSYLLLMSLFFFITFYFILSYKVDLLEKCCLFVSLFFSILCFSSAHALVFWACYEMTMLPLLLALLAKSPYSERFLAGWYLTCYVFISGIPLLGMIFYMSSFYGDYAFSSWGKTKEPKSALLLVLFCLFMTKVPLVPFHSWLPIVHAEASTFVSICLSGYVMKLGLMGIIRFCSNIFSSVSLLSSVLLLSACLFFMGSSLELDVKRWLAFLSLAHMSIPMICLFWANTLGAGLSALYCFGHGLSAGGLFYVFLMCYEKNGSRKWHVILCNSNVCTSTGGILFCLLLSACCMPPSTCFLAEVLMLGESLLKSIVLFYFSGFLLLSGLVPLVLMGLLFMGKGYSKIKSYSSGVKWISLAVLLSYFFLGWVVFML